MTLCIGRREFITLLGGAAAAWPMAARAQQPRKVWRIGFIAGASRPASLEVSQFGGFQQGMREHGYVEGKDFVIKWRFADAKAERYSEFAAEFVGLKVDVIVVGTPAALRAVQQATNTTPIVMGYSVDPVGNGFVASLARPGGNTTGLSSSQDDATPKQLELLTITVPNLPRVGLLANPDSPNRTIYRGVCCQPRLRSVDGQSNGRSGVRSHPATEARGGNAARSEIHTTAETRSSGLRTNPSRQCRRHDCAEKTSSPATVAAFSSPCILTRWSARHRCQA